MTRGLNWECHVCGDLRPDSKISVHSTQRDFGHGVIAQQNVRYCSDKQSCADGAQGVDFTGKPTVDDERIS
jgi:hypothetical protein